MNLFSDKIEREGYSMITDVQVIGDFYIMEEPEEVHEWISSRDAQKIFGLTSTQGAWSVIVRCERKHNFSVRKRNIGVDDYPRWLLNREDVLEVARLMGKIKG